MSEPSNPFSPSSNPPQIPPSDTVHIVATEITAQNKVHVTLSNGRTYEMTVHQGTTDVSGRLTPSEWKKIYDKIFQYFEAATGKREFASTQITLRGASAITSAADLETKNVRIVGEPSAIVYDDTGNQQSIRLPERSEFVAFNQLQRLAASYRGQATYSPATPSAPQQEYRTEIKDDRLKICEGREHKIVGAPSAAAPAQDPADIGQPYAYHALADQIRQLPLSGNTNWSAPGQFLGQTTQAIGREISDYRNAKLHGPDKQRWIQSNIKDIHASLNKARLLDPEKLPAAVTKYNANNDNPERPISQGRFNSLLSADLSTFNAIEKEILVRLYFEYISDKKSRFVGETFFKIFVDIHEDPAKDDYFQIVLIRERADGTKYATSIPDENIDTDRCAFIHIDADEQYSSYDRAARAGDRPLPNLNHKQNISSTLRVERTLPPIESTTPSTSMSHTESSQPSAPVSAPAPAEPVSVLKKNKVDDNGRCLDMSIAYEMIRKQNPGMSHQAILSSAQLPQLANELREQAANLIMQEDSEVFNLALQNSILDIPAFSFALERRYSQEQINASKASVLKIRDADAQARIRVIIATAPSTWDANQKGILKLFYSDFIKQPNDPVQNTDKGKYFNYLDGVFLQVLPKFQSALFPAIKCAIIRADSNIETYDAIGANTELNTDTNDWVFLNYNGKNHYDPINFNDSPTNAKVKELIKKTKERELRQFLDTISTDTADEVKRKLNTVIRKKYPEAYKACCRLMWKHDHDQWKNTPIERRLTEPGIPLQAIEHEDGKTIITPESRKVLDVEGYGAWRLTDNIQPAELVNLLNTITFSELYIRSAINTLPQI